MATKGTKYSDVSFSTPEGADPLGIGVPDLGRSSYDPIETIRSGWEASRQERLIKGDRDIATYQSYMENMPTVEGINKQIASTLNKELVEMGGLFKQQQEAGGFGGFAKTATGQKATARLSELENKIATDVPIYKHYSGQATDDLKVIRNPANKDKIDWELTNALVEAMQTAGNVEEFAQPFANNAGSLVVFKPEPQDIIGYATKVGSMIEGEEVISSDIKIDPRTNTMTTTQVTGADPEIIHKAYQTGYEFAEPNMRNAIDSLYEAAPDKKNADGIVMDAKEWWANKFSGLHGTTTTEKVSRLPKAKEDKPSGLGAGIPRIDGEMDTESMMEPIIMKSATITPAQYEMNWRGKKKEVSPETTDTEEMEFESYNMPLTGIDEVFDAMTPADAIDTSTGAEPDRTKIGSHKAVSSSYMPTYNGEGDIPVEYEVTDAQGNKVTKKYTVKPGKPIPMAVQRELIKRGVPMSYEPYLLTISVYGAAQEEKAMGAISWSDYVSKHGKTVITPWSSINNAFLTKMGAEEYQIADLKKNMLEMYNKLNRTP